MLHEIAQEENGVTDWPRTTAYSRANKKKKKQQNKCLLDHRSCYAGSTAFARNAFAMTIPGRDRARPATE